MREPVATRNRTHAKSVKAVRGEAPRVEGALAALKVKATKRTLQGMGRFGIPSEGAWGVTVADVRRIAKGLGRDHALAAALWKSGVYEARLLAVFVDEPERVTPAQMDRWCRDFDSWAVCDTACFHLFDRTPHAFERVARWAESDAEFVKRAAFALVASLGVHDKSADDAAFVACLPLIERAAADERNFVKKAVSWALRVLGGRSLRLHGDATRLARRLADSADAPMRWVGRDALRALASPATEARIARGERRAQRYVEDEPGR
jgi:3-methyladenine DNA glycosylase AlkD